MLSHGLVYRQHGDPNNVIQLEEYKLKESLDSDEVLVKMLAAPMNPADILMIQGSYALKPTFPAYGGNEGVGVVTDMGSGVKSLKIGSWVIPILPGWGTWRTYAIEKESKFLEIDNDIPLLSAATMAVNPCTAYRMLKDFEELKSGDSVIQNGANSGVGQAVIQIAKQKGVHTINVVRQRPDFDEIKEYLISLGADCVVTEEDVRSEAMEEIFKTIPKPKLALDCVGGQSSTSLMSQLSNKGTLVIYGAMSKQPVTLTIGDVVFKDIRTRGYWMSQWTKNNTYSSERVAMFKDISTMIKNGTLKLPICETIQFKNYVSAINNSMKPLSTKKQILLMQQ